MGITVRPAAPRSRSKEELIEIRQRNADGEYQCTVCKKWFKEEEGTPCPNRCKRGTTRPRPALLKPDRAFRNA